MEKKSIKVVVREVYGNTLYYPGCDKAETLALIANSKTLTRRTLQLAKDLGFEIKLEQSIPSAQWLCQGSD